MKFEKVSRDTFEKDCRKYIGDYSDAWYDNIKIPVRATKSSASYDLSVPMMTVVANTGTIDMRFIPTGIKAKIDPDKVLVMAPRSSMGKKGIMLANTIGVIDADYYNNPDNEGDIIIALAKYTFGSVLFNEGEKVAQIMILPYYTVEDDNVTAERTGGWGSTTKKGMEPLDDIQSGKLFADATADDLE